MKKNHKSINQRLRYAKSPEEKAKILYDWSKAWERETMMLISQLERAIQQDNYDLLCKSTGQLKAVAQKHFDALPKIIGESPMLQEETT